MGHAKTTQLVVTLSVFMSLFVSEVFFIILLVRAQLMTLVLEQNLVFPFKYSGRLVTLSVR